MLKDMFSMFCGWFVFLMGVGHFAIIIYAGNVYSIPMVGEYIYFNLGELMKLSIYWTISSILISAALASIKWAIRFEVNRNNTTTNVTK